MNGRTINTLQQWDRKGLLKGMDLVIVNGDTLSPEQELAQDLHAIVHVFSARMSGLRSDQKVIRDAAMHQDQAPGQ
jgi:predicted site-specific integrase-resolvase